MNNKMIAAVAVVAILLVAGVGAYMIIGSDSGSSKKDDNLATGNLTVLGNADNDNNLDST